MCYVVAICLVPRELSRERLFNWYCAAVSVPEKAPGEEDFCLKVGVGSPGKCGHQVQPGSWHGYREMHGDSRPDTGTIVASLYGHGGKLQEL